MLDCKIEGCVLHPQLGRYGNSYLAVPLLRDFPALKLPCGVFGRYGARKEIIGSVNPLLPQFRV